MPELNQRTAKQGDFMRSHRVDAYMYPIDDTECIKVRSTRTGTILSVVPNPNRRFKNSKPRALTKKDVIRLAFLIIEGCYQTAPFFPPDPVIRRKKKSR